MGTESKKFAFPELIWAGTEHSLELAMEAHNLLMAGTYGFKAGNEDEEETPYLFSLQGEIGVISIRGSLVNNDNWWNRYSNVTSYADIRRAMVHAANRSDVRAILLDIHSGGGAVSGLADTASLISTIDADVKPVFTFGDAMASAAYWLGSSARKVYSSSTSLLGSIGIIATHMEYSKQLKEAGVGVTVIRAGEFKALVNSYEPLSQAAKEQMQAQMNAAYKVFIEHVAENRGVSFAVADQKMGQGREFFGEDAVKAGLSDGLETFDGAMSKITAKLLDSKSLSLNNSDILKRAPMTRKALTQQEIAALAAGKPGATAAAGTDEAAAAEAAAAAAAAEQAAADEAAAAQAAAAAAEVTKSQNESNDAAVSFLRSELAARDESLVTVRVENTGLKASLDAVKVTHAALLKIAVASVSNMKVALGLSAIDMSASSAEQVLAEHIATSAQFEKAFRAGGVAATTAGTDAAADTQPSPLELRRIAATRAAQTK